MTLPLNPISSASQRRLFELTTQEIQRCRGLNQTSVPSVHAMAQRALLAWEHVLFALTMDNPLTLDEHREKVEVQARRFQEEAKNARDPGLAQHLETQACQLWRAEVLLTEWMSERATLNVSEARPSEASSHVLPNETHTSFLPSRRLP